MLFDITPTNAQDIWHLHFAFRSDVEGVPLVPLTVAGDDLDADALIDWLEADGPLVLVDDRNRANTITFLSDTEPSQVPEPASLFLLGSGLAVAACRWRKRAHKLVGPHS